MSKRRIIKVSVNLPEDVVASLKKTASKRGTTVTEVLRAAIGTEKYLAEKVESGSTVLLQDADKNITQLVFMNQKAG